MPRKRHVTEEIISKLREVLEEELGIAIEGWWLTEALAVSWDGTTVVGWGQHETFVEAWRATIPRDPLGGQRTGGSDP